MIYRRGVLPVLVLLFLVVFGALGRIVGGSSTQAAPLVPGRVAGATGAAADVDRALRAVQTAFNAGDVQLLCRPGALVDPAVVRQQNAQPGGCESEVESLMTNEPPMRLTVRRVAVRTDLATVEVTTARGTSASVDCARDRNAWLLSFSNGNDPLPVLAGTG